MNTAIESVEARILDMRLVNPFRTSFGEETERSTVIVRVSSCGVHGFGEAPVSRLPGYSYETAGTAFQVIRDFFAPRVAGLEIGGADGLAPLLSGLKGHPMARCGLEAAISDLFARVRGVSLRETYGGSAGPIEVGVSVGIHPSVRELLAAIRQYRSAGYRRVKLKIMPGWDIDVLAEVRREFPDMRLWADANQAYSRKDLDRLRRIDDFGLELLEQPLHADDAVGHAAWAAALRTPICLDEGVCSMDALRNAIELKAMSVLNIKPARVGGYLAAIRMEQECAAAGIRCWIGGMLETGIGRAHNVAIASRPGFTLPGDISASDRYFEKDLVEPPFSLSKDGRLDAGSGPGLGRDVDMDLLGKLTKRVAVVRV